MLEAALRVQGRVIHALMLREIRGRFGKMKLGYLWAILDPLFFIGIFALLHLSVRSEHPSGMPLLPFLVVGFGGFFYFRDIFTATTNAINANKPLLTYPVVTPFNMVLARGLLEFATVTVVFVMLFCIILSIDDTNRLAIEDPVRLLVPILLLSVLGLGSGFFYAALSTMFPSTPQVVTAFITRPAFFLSGLFFSADMIPAPARELLLLNPVLHGVELARSAFFIEFESTHADVTYLASFAFAMLFLGLLTQKALRHRHYLP